MNFEAEVLIESPGRINLIGEHLDYNGGQVMPAAIDLKVKLHFRKNGVRTCHIHSKNFDAHFDIDLDKIAVSEQEWHNYFLGVIHFVEQKYPGRVQGFDCRVESDLPIGSGVSSSAALECGIAKGLDQLFDIGLQDDEIITMARDAEHHFVGTKCGIMDQFAVVKGKKNQLMHLNCDTLTFDYVPAEIAPYTVLLLNTNVSHNLATSEYNLRRQECEAGLAVVQEKYAQYRTLAEVPEAVLKEFESRLAPKTYDRMIYVAQEHARTYAARKALEKKDLSLLGQLLFKSHEGLRDLYEVSCNELDFLVDFAKKNPSVLGARMMGGGFGGCTINLVHEKDVEDFIEGAKIEYVKKFNINLSSFTVSIGEGVKRIK